MIRNATTALLAFAAMAVATVAHAHPCAGKLPHKGQTFAGTVRYTVDGDTACIGPGRDPRTWIPVRLADFYAPERSEPGGAEAARVLRQITNRRWITCTHDHVSYGRSVAWCTISGHPIGDAMRAAGVREGGRGWRP